MSRLLVFCGTRAAIERFDMLPDWLVACSPIPTDQKQRTVGTFCAFDGAKMAVDRSMLHGWRAPADTIVLFDPSWPYGMRAPESIQAVARVDLNPFETMTPWRDSDAVLPLDPTRYRK